MQRPLRRLAFLTFAASVLVGAFGCGARDDTSVRPLPAPREPLQAPVSVRGDVVFSAAAVFVSDGVAGVTQYALNPDGRWIVADRAAAKDRNPRPRRDDLRPRRRVVRGDAFRHEDVLLSSRSRWVEVRQPAGFDLPFELPRGRRQGVHLCERLSTRQPCAGPGVSTRREGLRATDRGASWRWGVLLPHRRMG